MWYCFYHVFSYEMTPLSISLIHILYGLGRRSRPVIVRVEGMCAVEDTERVAAAAAAGGPAALTPHMKGSIATEDDPPTQCGLYLWCSAVLLLQDNSRLTPAPFLSALCDGSLV